LPYLYQLFVAQERDGEAVLRPLFYDFASRPRLALDHVDDQFMVGPALMQAPLLERARRRRGVVLPRGGWYALHSGRWLDGGRSLREVDHPSTTPLYAREGHIVPMQPGRRTTNQNDLSRVELHVFLRKKSRRGFVTSYEFDDGESFAYRTGVCSRFVARARVRGQTLELSLSQVFMGYRPARVRIVAYDDFARVVVNGVARPPPVRLLRGSWKFMGRPLQVWISRDFDVR
jgi:alpha-glucosidase